VLELATVTSAPGTGALLGSVTCPAKAPVVSLCAHSIACAPEKTTAGSRRATNHAAFFPHPANSKCAVALKRIFFARRDDPGRSVGASGARPRAERRSALPVWLRPCHAVYFFEAGLPNLMTTSLMAVPAPAFDGQKAGPFRIHHSFHILISYS
jgi:hypothetical protein